MSLNVAITSEHGSYRAKNVQVICPFSVGGGIHMPALDKIN